METLRMNKKSLFRCSRCQPPYSGLPFSHPTKKFLSSVTGVQIDLLSCCDWAISSFIFKITSTTVWGGLRRTAKHPPPKSKDCFWELHKLMLSVLVNVLSTYLTMAESKDWMIKFTVEFSCHWPLPTSYWGNYSFSSSIQWHRVHFPINPL